MSPAPLSPAQSSIAVAWGPIQQAVRDPELRRVPGGITQFVWQAFKQDYLARGLQPPSVGLQAMNSMVAMAAAQARAERALAKAIDEFRATGRDTALSAEHSAPDLDKSPFGPGPLGPNWRIRYEVPVEVEGISMSKFGTWESGHRLPATAGELVDMLGQIADGAAEDWGITVAGDVTGISITTF